MLKILSNKYVWITLIMVGLACVAAQMLTKSVGCHLDRKFASIHEGMAKSQVFELMADVTVPVYRHDESYVENNQLLVQSDFIWDDGVHNFKIVVNAGGIVQSKCICDSCRGTWIGDLLDKLGW